MPTACTVGVTWTDGSVRGLSPHSNPPTLPKFFLTDPNSKPLRLRVIGLPTCPSRTGNRIRRDGESKKQRTKLRKASGEYATGKFLGELKERFVEKGYDKVGLIPVPAEDSDQDPRIIEVHYPYITKHPDYVHPRVQIEIGCRSLIEPYSVRKFGSLVDEIYSDQGFASPFISIPTVHAERTFLEKLFLLHEEFSRPVEKIRVDRLSRHMYDVYHLSRNGDILTAIEDKDLYETIVSHRHKYAKIGGVDYNLHNPKTLNPTPHPDFVKAWEEDYNKMRSQMIYEAKPPSFQDLVSNIEHLKEKLATVSWEFALEFETKL